MAKKYLNIKGNPGQQMIIENFLHKSVNWAMLLDEDWKLYVGPCPCAEKNKNCSSPSFCQFRAQDAECDQDCSDQCTNNDIQQQNWWPDLYLKDVPRFGLGVFTSTPIPPNKFICEIVGELVSNDEFQVRRTTDYKDCNMHYGTLLTDEVVIDSYKKCGIGSLVNSSCKPNCIIKRITVDGYYRLTLWSGTSLIPKDTEINYQYNFDNDQCINAFVCQCGEVGCVSHKEKPSTNKKRNNSGKANKGNPSQKRAKRLGRHEYDRKSKSDPSFSDDDDFKQMW